MTRCSPSGIVRTSVEIVPLSLLLEGGASLEMLRILLFDFVLASALIVDK